MCVAFLRIPRSPSEPFVLASNRDEFLSRPGARAAWWSDLPSVFGGRDLKEGGAWLAVARDGRFGLITNFRDPKLHVEGRESRGAIIPAFLRSSESAGRFLDRVSRERERYNPFNLVLGSLTGETWFYSSREERALRLPPGVHGVSNGELNSNWPKVIEGKRRFEEILRARAGRERLLELMEDRTLAADPLLPSTGVPLEVERALSAIFIRMPGYGTRCSTLIQAQADGSVEFLERSYGDDGAAVGDVEERFFVLGTPPTVP